MFDLCAAGCYCSLITNNDPEVHMLTIARDGKARRIASEWHVPGGAISAFSHTGLIDDLVQYEVQREIDHLTAIVPTSGDWQSDHAASLADLTFLAEYLEAEGHRTPVEGWSGIWG